MCVRVRVRVRVHMCVCVHDVCGGVVMGCWCQWRRQIRLWPAWFALAMRAHAYTATCARILGRCMCVKEYTSKIADDFRRRAGP